MPVFEFEMPGTVGRRSWVCMVTGLRPRRELFLEMPGQKKKLYMRES